MTRAKLVQQQLDVLKLSELLRELKLRAAKSELTDPTLSWIRSREIFDVALALARTEYGTGGMTRRDVIDVRDDDVVRAADAVCAVVHRDSMRDNGNGTYMIRTLPFGVNRWLCPDEQFHAQPVIQRGGSPDCSTAFLVAENLIVTAAHVVAGMPRDDIRFVFGYRWDLLNRRMDIELKVPAKDVYAAAAVTMKLDPYSTGVDWAVATLTRCVKDIRPLQLRTADKIENDAKVYVLGHPFGLPLKFAGPALVRDNLPLAYFMSNLETCQGNSGSPVLNCETHLVEGILSADLDRDPIQPDPHHPSCDCCYSYIPCTDAHSCIGKRVVRATEVAACLAALG